MEHEFDRFADQYEIQHKANIAVTGEDPAFFAEYKIAELARAAKLRGIATPCRILDFGSGIGNSIPFFRSHFPGSELVCADASSRSLEISRMRFPGDELRMKVDHDRIPSSADAYDIAFSACVFHHIAHAEHHLWLCELLRVTRSGGMLSIFEHNPLNPLTVRAVNTCPFDENAKLVLAKALARAMRRAGWRDCRIQYHLFFPRLLSWFRPLEPALGWLPFGGQYSVTGRKP